MTDTVMIQAQIDSLKAMLDDALKRLAASQSRELRLREALSEAMEWNWMDDDACEIIPEWVRETISLPKDDSALREMIAAEREACAAVCDALSTRYGTADECADAIRERKA